jgi:hypothetical protein
MPVVAGQAAVAAFAAFLLVLLTVFLMAGWRAPARPARHGTRRCRSAALRRRPVGYHPSRRDASCFLTDYAPHQMPDASEGSHAHSPCCSTKNDKVTVRQKRPSSSPSPQTWVLRSGVLRPARPYRVPSQLGLRATCVVAVHLAEWAWAVMDRGMPAVICDTDGTPVTPSRPSRSSQTLACPRRGPPAAAQQQEEGPQQVLAGHGIGA